MGGSSPPPPHISVAVGVTVGLLASFVQSLGLTIQRKSHLANEALPVGLRQRDWRRPLWLGGFLIFICSNLFGTIFQIGALPIVVLGPLGAVSLLWNAFFARFILGDEFSVHLVAGIILIAGGAVLIGIFGVVPEETHTLDELVRLYTRPPFLIWISLLSFSLAVIIVFAHFAEWALERRIARMYPSAPPLTPRPSHSRRKHNRRWSAPPRPSLPPQPPKSSPALLQGSPDPKYGAVSDRRPSSTTTNLAPTNTAVHSRNPGRNGAELTRSGEDGNERAGGGKKATLLRIDVEAKELEAAASSAAIEKSRLILGVAYGGASGTLSGLCLLFAKTGIELLILTIVGQNQFGRVEAWMIVLVLLVAAVLQLFYLNRALRLVGPTLICPLAFCFYNLSSIVSGLIYYDQWDQLSGLQFGLVALGTAILLAGVWIVSLKSSVPKEQPEEREMDVEHERTEQRMTDEPESFRDSDSDDSDVEPVEWIPRGLAIGIGAASPGFDIRPAAHHHRRSRTVTLPTSAVFPTPTFADNTERTHLVDRTASETDLEAAAGELEQRRTSRDGSKSRGFSMSGSMYVGRRDSAPSSPSVGSDANPGLGIAVGGAGTGQQPPDSPSGRKRWRKFTPLGRE